MDQSVLLKNPRVTSLASLPIFCINLDKYPERWNRTKLEFKRTFPNSEQPKLHRYPAIDRTADVEPGRGCGETFCQLVQRAKSNKWPYVIVCEDDVQFVDGAYAKLQKALSSTPSDADILLGGSYCLRFSSPKVFNAHWLKVNGSYASHHFVIFYASAYDKVLGYKDHPNYRHLDRFIGNRFAGRNLNVYVIWPMIAKQYDGFSTTMRKRVQYNTLMWARKHSLLWYDQRHHASLPAFSVPPKQFCADAVQEYTEQIKMYLEFVKHKDGHIQNLQCQDKNDQIKRYTENTDTEFSDISIHALYWFATPQILDRKYKKTYGVSMREFEEFRSSIVDYYVLMNAQDTEISAQTIDVFHLILAYQQPEIFNAILKRKYGMSWDEFKKVKQEHKKKA